MSAYIVSKEHILFLVNAAMSRRISQHGFSWHHNGEHNQIHAGDYERAAEVANLLWLENIKSVSARYPGESSDTLPGPNGGSFVVDQSDLSACFDRVEPVQVLKSIQCYEYQSCEHDEWATSEARTICQALRLSAIHSLPGYEAAEWGAPKPMAHAVSLMAMSRK